jgi:hypothetical protein
MFAEINKLKDFLPPPGLDSDGAKGQLTAFKEKSKLWTRKTEENLFLPRVRIISGCEKYSIFGVKCVVVELQTQVVLDGDNYIDEGSLSEVERKVIDGNVSDGNLVVLWRTNIE